MNLTSKYFFAGTIIKKLILPSLIKGTKMESVVDDKPVNINKLISNYNITQNIIELNLK